MSDHDIERQVSERLNQDPEVDGRAIAVAAEDGNVTLRGTVGGFREKRDAQKVARRVRGVTSVTNDLEVRVLTEHGRGDAALRGDILRALHLDRSVPDTVDARVDDGWATLTGTAWTQHQREVAMYVTSNITGILGVDNEIDVRNPEPSTADVKEGIRDAFKRSAKDDADHVSVDIREGTVVLGGYVSSWAEHDEAVAAAWAAPGVSNVEDRIEVIP